jgi:hypothetical protein
MTDPITAKLDAIERSWKVDRRALGYATPDTALMLAALRGVLKLRNDPWADGGSYSREGWEQAMNDVELTIAAALEVEL